MDDGVAQLVLYGQLFVENLQCLVRIADIKGGNFVGDLDTLLDAPGALRAKVEPDGVRISHEPGAAGKKLLEAFRCKEPPILSV